MTFFRAAILALLFAAVGIALVALRVEQTRAAARTLRMEAEWVHTRRALWSMQARVARLQDPRRLRDHVDLAGVELVPARTNDFAVPRTRLVSDWDQE